MKFFENARELVQLHVKFHTDLSEVMHETHDVQKAENRLAQVRESFFLIISYKLKIPWSSTSVGHGYGEYRDRSIKNIFFCFLKERWGKKKMANEQVGGEPVELLEADAKAEILTLLAQKEEKRKEITKRAQKKKKKKRRALEDLFLKIDKENNKDLEFDEFMDGLQDLDIELSTEDIESLFKYIDMDQGGSVQVEEFTSFFLRQWNSVELKRLQSAVLAKVECCLSPPIKFTLPIHYPIHVHIIGQKDVIVSLFVSCLTYVTMYKLCNIHII
ncbi:hypothetical protein RFI_16126 [Reticulomyxa filosa]|uniref:EF-hand domain-containing protein n=1 Tax=Reticulomyxa filosa TaxID=46433 RepID=X6N558_RETFI|nr:hypothetical protein RFI_16126 [Reticulomyxa filosa]|eukprot:ETO21078.1 hypothetical protein RFI_16126 [Reticulomyxa filosa]